MNDNTDMVLDSMKPSTKGAILTEDDALLEVQQEEQEEKEKDDTLNDRLGIDIDDPQTHGAATKLQAGYRGFQSRRKQKEVKENNEYSLSSDE